MNEENESIGDIFNDAKMKAIKGIAIGIGIIVYLAMIAYSGVHNFTLMTKGVPADLILWAVVGIISLELTAIGLPLALHYWVHAPLQRIATFIFYGIDLGIVFINVVLDFAINAGTTLPSWGASWLLYVVPATPIIVGVGYSILFVLDPAQRKHQLMEQFRESTHEAHLSQMIAGAKSKEINALVEEKGRADSEAMVRAILGQRRGGHEEQNGRKAQYNLTAPLPAPLSTPEASPVKTPSNSGYRKMHHRPIRTFPQDNGTTPNEPAP